MEEKKERRPLDDDKLVYLRKWFILYPPEEEETVLRFKEFCKEYAGNRYISGIKTLMYLADFQSQIAVLNRELAELKASLSPGEEEEIDEEGIATLGGTAK